jgi:hypothetical protein
VASAANKLHPQNNQSLSNAQGRRHVGHPKVDLLIILAHGVSRRQMEIRP